LLLFAPVEEIAARFFCGVACFGILVFLEALLFLNAFYYAYLCLFGSNAALASSPPPSYYNVSILNLALPTTLSLEFSKLSSMYCANIFFMLAL